MENVVAFNTELSGLYDTKPPISKAKMAAITRSAMKAIKFYKHVVQSVEKFILKCKPEYKIPGLYVIDSIVRQSRHQFGPEKDVFAPRFARNMKQTFANLFRCAPEDKSRIIRVLNLWQKNQVFAPEVIQPLFDLADPNHPIYQMQAQNLQDLSSISNGLNTSGSEANTSNVADENHGKSQEIGIGHQTANTLDQSSIRQLQQLQQIFMRQANENSSGTGANQSDSVKFNKKLLDYDYGEDEEEEKSTSPRIPNLLDGNNLTQLLKDPNVLRQLQTLQKLKQQEEKQMKLNEMKIQEEAFEKHLQNVLKGTSGPSNTINNQQVQDMPEKEIEFVTEDDKIEVINLDGNDSRSTTPDRDRYKRRRTSRSRSRDRGRDRDRRRRSRSRSRNSRSPKTNRRRASRERKDKEREKEKEKEKEYERERRRKGLPDIKKEHLSVCSTTLWVGHLSKLVQQEELSDTFGKYGDIVSIDMIHPRGCAFIVMNRRQDAHKAMGSLKNHKLQGRAITISWAAGKGVKSKEWKDYWDLDLGVSFIPWNKLSRDTDLETLEEGGMFDEDSMPEWMKDKINQKKEHKEKGITMYGMEGIPNVDTSQPPPPTGTIMPGVPMVPPFPMGPVPRLMPPMGVPMPGNMVPQMGMPPNMVPGMPPPHMMLPPGGMVPGFPPIPPPMDKSMPPPNSNSSDGPNNLPPPFMGNMGGPPHMAHHQGPMFGNMGMPPQFQQPPNNAPSSNSISNQNDDHMDIEMEDEAPANVKPLPQINFNQPPPIFGSFPNDSMQRANDNRQNDREMVRGDRRDNDYRDHSRDRDLRDHDLRSDFKNRENRDRNRGPWGSDHDLSEEREHPQHREVVKFGNDRDIMSESIRADFNPMGPGLDQGSNRQDLPQIWRDNNVPVANFNQHPPNFNENMRGRGMSIPPPIDMNNPPPPPHHIRPPHEFFDIRRDNKDFNQDDRRPPSGGMQRDFFPNIGNRFGPPQGVVRGGMPPMRGGPPPPQFAPRLGPMFIRGPPHPGPPAAPFNFNDRPPFEREERGRMRGNNMGDRRGRGNWRDDDDGGGNNRRGNRFQNRDRDGFDREDRKRDRNDRDRNDRDRDRDSRNRNSRDRSDRDRGGDRQFNNRENRENRDSSRNRFSEPSREEEPSEENYVQPPQPPKLTQDTEEDWDLELSDHNIGTANENQKQDQGDSNINDDFSQDDFKGFDSQAQQPEHFPDESNDNARSFNDDFQQRAEEAISSNEDEDTFAVPTTNEQESEKPFAHVNTPLYDELPGQKPEMEGAAAVEEPCSEPLQDTEATND